MKKEMKTHLVYAVIFVLVIFSMLYYQDTVNQKLITEMSENFQLVAKQFTSLQQSIDTQIGELAAADAVISANVESVSSSLAETGEELEQLRMDSEEQIASLEEDLVKAQLANQDFSAVIENVFPSVVSVITDVGSGSGFLISDDGYVVTNRHVVEDAQAATIYTFNGEAHSVTLIGKDGKADIAILKINVTNAEYLLWANSNKAVVGEKVIAVGNPAGLDFSVTQGIVSALKRTDGQGNEYIQIDVPINPGNSGGPLINGAGKVLGVNTMKLLGFESVGFALSSNYVEDVVDGILP
jgi:S1-C subfamily serine protease